MLPSSERMLHVLVIEDNPGDVLLAREAIHSVDPDAELLIVYDGEQALRVINELQFKADIVFLDLNVPKMDGFQILRANKDPTVPFIVLSSSANPLDRSRSLELGAKDYIVKPLDLAGHFSVIQEALTKWTVR